MLPPKTGIVFTVSVLCLCVNKPKSGSGDTPCSVGHRILLTQRHKQTYKHLPKQSQVASILGGVCMFVYADESAKSRAVSTITLQPLEMQTDT